MLVFPDTLDPLPALVSKYVPDRGFPRFFKGKRATAYWRPYILGTGIVPMIPQRTNQLDQAKADKHFEPYMKFICQRKEWMSGQ